MVDTEKFLLLYSVYLPLLRFISATTKPAKQEDESDIESVKSEEFDELIEKFEPDGRDDDFHFDEETLVDMIIKRYSLVCTYGKSFAGEKCERRRVKRLQVRWT